MTLSIKSAMEAYQHDPVVLRLQRDMYESYSKYHKEVVEEAHSFVENIIQIYVLSGGRQEDLVITDRRNHIVSNTYIVQVFPGPHWRESGGGPILGYVTLETTLDGSRITYSKTDPFECVASDQI